MVLRIVDPQTVSSDRPTAVETAALRAVDGTVFTADRPARHGDLLRLYYESFQAKFEGEQGFVANTGRFLCRKKARNVARRFGQLLPTATQIPILTSEDLW